MDILNLLECKWSLCTCYDDIDNQENEENGDLCVQYYSYAILSISSIIVIIQR